MPEFDPYVEWLEIDPALCPPNFYDLLGITPFESDAQVIESAFELRLRHVRSFQTGPRGIHTQDLLNELAQARLCLLDEQNRLAYDDFLRGGRSKPPVLIENLSGENKEGNTTPPIATDAIQIDKSQNSELKPEESKRPNTQLSVLYVSVCLVALLTIWGAVKWTRGKDDRKAQAGENSNKEAIETKPPPKKIINIVEEKKGILPAANNSYLLAPQNAKIDQPHPTIADTSDGQLLDQWQPVKSKVRWEIWVNSPGHYEAIVSYNATNNGKFSRIFVKADEEFPKSVKMRTAEALDKFFEEEFVILFREKGAHVINISVEGEVGDFRLRTITLRPNRLTREE